ncbi:UvrD-helicase domain-containing protein [Candidatus Peregrinibacteria bacterium]|nr:MAG: UvrD-helicase domain-containing protein [Candidatus Peregrinibacteria bacterium]
MHQLNSEQQRAVVHQNGPLLVVAGAGTGKTRVITERIFHITDQKWCKNEQILALTFTEKATQEIEERVDERMPIGYESISIHTFHGFCDTLLRRYGLDIGLPAGFKILQGVEQWQFLKKHLYEFELDYYRPLGNPSSFISALLSAFSRLKEELNTPEQVVELAQKKLDSAAGDDAAPGGGQEKTEAIRLLELGKAYQKYQTLMLENGFLDYADLHYYVIQLLEKRPNILKFLQGFYQYILVDEYQDTNIAQNRLVDLLAAQHKNLMVVGDDDQSIYKFRGAAISNILQFDDKYPEAKKVVLTQNYRSNQAILDFAYASIQKNNPDRLEVKSNINKKITGQSSGSADSVELLHATTIEQEVEFVIDHIRSRTREGATTSSRLLSGVAILARTNAHLYPFVEGLRQANIPYHFLSEKGLYQKEEIRDLMAVLRVVSNPTDNMSLYRVLRMPQWKLSMELILSCLEESKKGYQTVFHYLKTVSEAEFLMSTLQNLIDFSRDHSVGEVLYRFTEITQLYENLLQKETIEAEEQIVNIATFFGKIKEFESGNAEKTVKDFVNYLDLAEEAGENPAAKFELEDREGVFVSTIHGSKGLEFDTVFVPHLTNDAFPARDRQDAISIPDELIQEMTSNESDSSTTHLQEERRLFYVAVTRAKEKLYLSYSDYYNPSSAKAPRKKKLTRFVEEILDDVHLLKTEKTTEGVERFLKPKKAIQPESLSAEKPAVTQFSYSQLQTFADCPRKYQYQYLYKLPQPFTGALSFGSTMHNTLQKFYDQVIASKQASLFEDYNPDISLDKILSLYEESWIDQGYERKEHRDLRRQRERNFNSILLSF